MHNLPRLNEYFVLSLALSKNDMIQMVDKPSKSLTFKALLYLNVAVHVQVCRLFCLVYIPLFSLVQLGYPAITNTFVVNPDNSLYWGLHYNEDPAITNIFLATATLCYSGVPL